MEELAVLIHSSSSNNGFLHVARIYVHNARIISIPELYHLTHIDSVLGTRMSRKIVSFDHPIYLRSLPDNQVLACMFTSQPRTRLSGVGFVDNIPIKENVFLYSNGIFLTSSFNFFTHFYIFNDINFLPPSVSFKSLEVAVSDSFKAYQQVISESNYYITYDRGGYSFTRNHFSEMQESVIKEIAAFDERMRIKEEFDKEVARAIRGFNDYKHYNFAERGLVAEARRLVN